MEMDLTFEGDPVLTESGEQESEGPKVKFPGNFGNWIQIFPFDDIAACSVGSLTDNNGGLDWAL